MSNIAFKLVSPSQDLLSTDTRMVIVPGAEGDMGLMAGHSSVVSTLRAGEVILRDGDTDVRWFIEGGFVEVTATQVTLLAEHAVAMTDVTLAGAEQELKDAQSAFDNIDKANTSMFNRATMELNVAKAKIKAIESPAYA